MSLEDCIKMLWAIERMMNELGLTNPEQMAEILKNRLVAIHANPVVLRPRPLLNDKSTAAMLVKKIPLQKDLCRDMTRIIQKNLKSMDLKAEAADAGLLEGAI